MTADLIKAFVTSYVVNLKERTREERTGVKWGIDWLIYNLGQAIYGKPVRLPFMRQPGSTTATTKSEAEFGIDLSFLSIDKTRLTVFVLKDEALTNRNWVAQSFYDDLVKAASPDLTASGLEQVTDVEIILVYNRDEDANGVTLYDRFVAGCPPRLADRATLSFTRWNLSTVVDLTLSHLLTPALLPQRFFGQINYLCSQMENFSHGSEEWEKQLIPGWKRFVGDVISHDGGIRGISMIPVVLIILRQHGEKSSSLETGWIDLIEWTAIPLWKRFAETDNEKTRGLIVQFWQSFYLTELERFYKNHINDLSVNHAIDQIAGATMVGVAAASTVAYWHIGRLGILSMGVKESVLEETTEQRVSKDYLLREIANFMVRLFNANDSALRPLLDINHVEIALLAFTLANASRLEELSQILGELMQRLYLRRIHDDGDIPFPDGYNSLENVFEQVASGNKLKLVTTDSSFLVLMLLEMCCLFEKSTRDDLLTMFHRRLVLGFFDQGPTPNRVPLNLMSWIPPDDWEIKVLTGYVEDGVAVSRGPLSDSQDSEGEELVAELSNFVREMRAVQIESSDLKAPLSALFLACIRHKSPLPPEIWRAGAFPTHHSAPQ